MSEYMDETSLTDEEIAEAIAAAKKAKAAKMAKASEQAKPEEPPKQDKPLKLEKTDSSGEESSKELFNEIDQTVDDFPVVALHCYAGLSDKNRADKGLYVDAEH